MHTMSQYGNFTKNYLKLWLIEHIAISKAHFIYIADLLQDHDQGRRLNKWVRDILTLYINLLADLHVFFRMVGQKKCFDFTRKVCPNTIIGG